MPARKLALLEKKPALNILMTLGRYEFLTADQVTTFLCAPTSRTMAIAFLTELTNAGYTTMLKLNDPSQPFGFTKGVWTLTKKGCDFVESLGVDAVTLPSQGPYGPSFLPHALAVASTGMTFERLAASHPRLDVLELRTERYLKRFAPRMEITYSAGREHLQTKQATYTPDALAHFTVDGARRVAAFEIDRGTEDPAKFRRKTAEILAWTGGPYKQTYGDSPMGVAVIVAPGPPRTSAPARRLELLMQWMRLELSALGKQNWGRIFYFRTADPAAYTRIDDDNPALSPEELFLTPRWLRLTDAAAQPLIGGLA